MAIPPSVPSAGLTAPVASSPVALSVAPARVIRGRGVLAIAGDELARLGKRPLIVGGDRALHGAAASLDRALEAHQLQGLTASAHPDCSEAVLERLRDRAHSHRADAIIGIGGGKALDTAKLLAHQLQVPVATVPTSAATCAAWTALSNVYSDEGAFLYDVPLDRCPDLLILDYDLVVTAPQRTLVAGIGDAIAKWYEASISSGHLTAAPVVSAVQQARVLRDLLLQRSADAIAHPGGEAWEAVVDGSVLLAGVIGGLGGAQCRTVAAHAVHNGLTHLAASHGTLHGEKVAYGILVQLRLEETIAGSQLATAARQQLLEFYGAIGLPTTLEDLGLSGIAIADLYRAAAIACEERSDIHHLPFPVEAVQVAAAMVSTTAPCWPRPAAIAPDGDSRDESTPHAPLSSLAPRPEEVGP
ncbi:MAG: iron-containing alcohol dehydrogenase family protein [Cyanobacteria bacterium]|nr:iron-containing alcohol dehydrogenase family protein [Cyanobacteriota bacterium]